MDLTSLGVTGCNFFLCEAGKVRRGEHSRPALYPSPMFADDTKEFCLIHAGTS